MSQVREWGSQFTSNLGRRWTYPVTARRVPSKQKGEQRGAKKMHVHSSCLVVYIYVGMLGVIERYQLYICITIIIGMNVVDNLNSVQVINKPCMSSRNMSLLPRATLHSDSEQFLRYIFQCWALLQYEYEYIQYQQ